MFISDYQNAGQNHKNKTNPSKYVTNSKHLEKTATIKIILTTNLEIAEETRRTMTSERVVASSPL
jgi:hypothetical protein